MLSAIKPVAEALVAGKQKPLGKPYFSDPRYQSEALDFAPFSELTGTADVISAVDAGNQELLGGASASLQFVRAYANAFSGKKRIHQERHEFFCLTQCTDGANFESRIFDLFGGLLQEKGTLTINGKEVQDAEERSKAAQVGALSRRYAEWALCQKMLERFEDVLVVKDGTLQTSVKKESFYAKRALEKTGSKKRLAALSKTCTLVTDTGHSVTDAVMQLKPIGSWAYQWIGQSKHPDHPVNIAVAKLHANAKRAFRVETLTNQELAWQTLAENASDPAFLGYPYALVDADHCAKVTNAEAASLKGFLSAVLGNKAESIFQDTDAHAWLSKL